ncbi:hypothetical protein UFOVP1138_5 [uncultured Caudovirales phage]|uniref:Uncharacterized protein n=1 Tax=uncultured Caudovirales phage TaxID=2100421 RepID=A0A6J5QNV8_9CAUD|nr:hypothetical protein UFOVP975_26 [uncultured Caudovirales phage]CAB4186100.1 hypothetical protein UFOVP1138_5 [uncultured Caudovirales phage]CAB4204377.1 hypothetical protein UFOVP1394_2 [uncultured Caudovirales phage]
MSRRSRNRDIVLQRAKNAETLEGTLKILESSPYRQHQKVAPLMRKQVEEMSASVIASLKKQEESQDFERMIMQ